MIRVLVAKSKVNKHITPHSFRRSFATFHSRNKVPMKNIQQLMGHASIMTTRMYILMDDESSMEFPTPYFKFLTKKKEIKNSKKLKDITNY